MELTDTEILKLLVETDAIYMTKIDENEYYIGDTGCGCCMGQAVVGELAEFIYKRLKSL